ncbi:MAG: hypothetical protein A2052_04140 [Deltaproteobacteria bacterium GWA2_54_12]|nr:MAG: hypothetical protein A2052_04140 [Deltaproteobacteria bacterium GWA2_54_12]
MKAVRPCPHAKGNGELMMCMLVLNFTKNMFSATPEKCAGGAHGKCPLYLQNEELTLESKKGGGCGQGLD